MDLYEIHVRKSVEKDIANVPHESVSRILNAVEDLMQNPVPHSARKLSGSVSLYRIRVGEYRVLYEVCHEKKQVTIVFVRHRRTAYRGF
ncbi:type II toxin-antitoxin system RelE/ParE family toxin [Methanocalculus natronophilus]|uniref:type II toxin-antitoxin system RelE family toxin n=1 Tax=Methanocalculus natronophilus TaxID=1262400 RepID=UPI0031B647C2